MAKSAKKMSFEQALARLDEIVSALEAGDIGIEDSITHYEEAMQLKAHCQRILDHAEQRIRRIQIDAAGEVTAAEFGADDEAAAPDSSDET